MHSSAVNSWLLEQNNCHFPASGPKVMQHNEMYKKRERGGMGEDVGGGGSGWQTGGMLNQM